MIADRRGRVRARRPPGLRQEVTLKVHHFTAARAMPPTTLLVPWCDKIAKESNNRLKCQIYPAMQLGGTPPPADRPGEGRHRGHRLHAARLPAGRFPLMEVFELPFVSSYAEATSQAAQSTYDRFARQGIPGIKMLSVNVHDNGYVHTRDKPIRR